MIDLSIPQSEALYSTAPSIGVCAGFGSGKSTTGLHRALLSLHEYPGIPVAYGAPTYPLIRDIFYPMVEEFCIEHRYRYDINKSANVVNIPGLGNIICQSLSDPDKIVGWECGDVILDEFDILKSDLGRKAFEKMKARARYKFPKFKRERDKIRFGAKRKINQVMAVSTPEGFKAFYEMFEEGPLPDSVLIRMSTYSNIENLPANYIDELLANYPPQLVKAYIMGVFTNLTSGAVYPNYDRVLNNSVRTVKKGDILHVGMDFNIGKMSAVIFVIDYFQDTIFDQYGNEKIVLKSFPIAVDEVYKVKDTPAMILALKERYKGHTIKIYPDATAQYARSTTNASLSDIKLLKEAGFEIIVDLTNPLVRDRVVSLNACLCNALGYRGLMINSLRCKNLCKCLEQQVYDKNGVPDKQKDLDHLPDAAGYFINKMFGVAKPSTKAHNLIMG